MLLSAVIPVFNEEESLPALHAELVAVAAANGYDLEIILIDDGSKDGSWQTIERLAKDGSRVRGVRFRGHCGEAGGPAAGCGLGAGGGPPAAGVS